MSRFDPQVDEELVATKAWDSRLLWRLIGWARPHRRRFAVSLVVLMALFAVQLLGPYLWRLALDGPVRGVSTGEVERGVALEHLLWICGAFLGLVALQGWLSYLEVAQLARTGQGVIHDLRTHLFEHVGTLDVGFFDERPTGSLVTRVTSDVENLAELYTSGLVVLSFDLFKVAVLVGLLFWIDVDLALVVAALLPLLILISLAFRGRARDSFRHLRARLASLNGYLQEVLTGIRVVQLFHRERLVSARFDRLLEPYLQASLRALFYFALFFPAIGLTVYGIQGAALRVGGAQIAADSLEIGVFFQFWFYLSLLVNPVRELGERYNVLQSAFASAERVFQVLDTKAHVVPPATPEPLATPVGRAPHVRFEDVSFSYTEGTPVLEEVTFEIPPGATIAVVGATGAGKSTLVNLLLRFYDVSSGRVSVDGTDVREVDTSGLRERFGLVLQEDFLFAGTVRDNIEMGRENVDEESVADALSTSRAHEFLERLGGDVEAGLAAPVAERGATFSTGERQLLAMARALAGRPDLVVLDEATASVDSATEAAIEAATRDLLEGRSALVVAHRLSTIRRADQILVMHRGRLREQGTHEELLERGGLYARLYALQFEGQEGGRSAG